ncbi:MAG: peptidoglycan DD-metalloendopeptidase family protein, partial [Oscillospiraceae bacterium]|nr:peptidoglycan DD-metalloendopeptidase family protein [Oscillospiraceae bacterium]
MEEKARGRGFFAFICIILILLIAAITTASLFMLVPKRNYPLKAPGNGIGVESLSNNEQGWMDGGMKLTLLAVAVSRGWEADESIYTEAVATLHFSLDGIDAPITLLRDKKTGELAFRDTTDRVVTHNQKLLIYLLDKPELYPLFCSISPNPITVMGREVDAYTYDYRGISLSGESLRFSLDEQDFEQPISEFVLEDLELSIEDVPQAARLKITTETDEEQQTLFSGVYSDVSDFAPISHIPYLYTFETADANGNIAKYQFIVEYHIKPTFRLSHDNLLSGGSLVIFIDGVKETDKIECFLSFDYKPYFSRNGTRAMALIPLSFALKTGEYSIYVSCGGYEETFIIGVSEDEYEVQNLEISGDGAAANTAEANREYANTMHPLFNSYDPEIYWEGVFIQPVSGTITTPFGVYRYTNGSEYATRHAGIDIANAEGTPILAANSGVVLFSGFLELSGNTILIEHGMGLHTLYMH